MGGVLGRGVALTVKGPSWRGIDTIEKGWERFGVCTYREGPTIEKGWEGFCTLREGRRERGVCTYREGPFLERD